MAELLASMPVLPLSSDCIVRFEAIDPTDGTAIGGVSISLATIYAVDVEGEGEAIGDIGPMMLVPGPTPLLTPTLGESVRGGL